MGKTETITARLTPQVRKEVEQIFSELGLSTSQAINLFFNQVRIHKGLPFDVSVQNKSKQNVRRQKGKRRTRIDLKNREKTEVE